MVPIMHIENIQKTFHIKLYFCNLALNLKKEKSEGYLFSKSKYLIISLPNKTANILVIVISNNMNIMICKKANSSNNY